MLRRSCFRSRSCAQARALELQAVILTDCADRAVQLSAVDVIAVVGPTAAGKSEIGCDVALAHRGEVVNCDSMQTYVGMDIATAKLSASQRRAVPHHLMDIWPISHEASVAEYQQLARGAVREIAGRSRLPIFVGGSGLYLRAAIDDLRLPGTDPNVRRRWELELERVGSVALHRQLASQDPIAAAAILSTNGRRIVRAMEVIELTGSFEARLPVGASYLNCLQVGIALPREILDQRISVRVDEMFADGVVDEVRRLREQGLDASPTARLALGYPQVCRLLDGEADEAQTRDSIKTATRRFARRQLTWLRRDHRIEWFDATDAVAARSRVLARVGQWLAKRPVPDA